MDFVIGQVLTAGEAGLTVRAEGQPLSGRDLWINEALLPGYSPGLSGTLTGTAYLEPSVTAPVEVPVAAGQLTRAASPLQAGDRVVLLTADHQTYYLICKAVRDG